MLASLPKRQKIALLRLRSLPAFCLFLICDWDTHFFLGTGVGKKNALNIVQMKRNGSNCPTGRNLDKLSLKMREESHFMRDAWKQTTMREFHGNCGKHGRSALEKWWGGGGAFPTCTNIFFKCFACVDNFFKYNPLHEFFLFQLIIFPIEKSLHEFFFNLFGAWSWFFFQSFLVHEFGFPF